MIYISKKNMKKCMGTKRLSERSARSLDTFQIFASLDKRIIMCKSVALICVQLLFAQLCWMVRVRICARIGAMQKLFCSQNVLRKRFLLQIAVLTVHKSIFSKTLGPYKNFPTHMRRRSGSRINKVWYPSVAKRMVLATALRTNNTYGGARSGNLRGTKIM